MATTPDGQVLAGWWIRAGAVIADWLILTPALVVVAVPSLAAHWTSVSTWWNAGYGGQGTLVTDNSAPTPPVLDSSTEPGFILFASLLATAVVYALVFLHWKQATPGKLLVGLKVRTRDEPGRLTWPTILRRVVFVAAVIAGTQVPTVGVGFLVLALVDHVWPLWDHDKQTLHDKFAATNVILSKVESSDPVGQPPPNDTEFRSIAGSGWARLKRGSSPRAAE